MIDHNILLLEIREGPLSESLMPFVLQENDIMVADMLNSVVPDLFVTTERTCTALGIMTYYPDGPVVAAELLNKLEAAEALVPPLKWAMIFLKTQGLNMGDASVHAMLDMMASNSIITLDEAEKLKMLGMKAVSRSEFLFGQLISINDVARAVRNDDGSSKL